MEYELYHHGILGMKWGIRRFQNKDGSLTSAGKKRYRNKDGTLNKEGRDLYNISDKANDILKSVSKRSSLYDKAKGTYGKTRDKLGDKILKENDKILQNLFSEESEAVREFRDTLSEGREYAEQEQQLLSELYNDSKRLNVKVKEYVDWSWDRMRESSKSKYYDNSKKKYFEEFNKEKDGSIDAHDDLLDFIIATDPKIKKLDDLMWGSITKARNKDLPNVIKSVLKEAGNLSVDDLAKNNDYTIINDIQSFTSERIYNYIVENIPIDKWSK